MASLRPADRLLLTIGAAAVVVRVAVATGAAVSGGPQVLHAPDTAGYLAPAAALWHHGAFAGEHGPEVLRTPGYPLLLLPGLALGAVEGVTVLLQALLAVATVVAVYGIAAQLYSRLAAVLAAALYALEPLSILYSGRLLSETLFTACLTGALFCLVRAVAARAQARSLAGPAAAAGLLLAAAALTRPVAWPLALAVGLGSAWLVWRPTPVSGQPRWLPVALLTATALVPPLAWQVRNAVRGGYDGLSAIVDVNLYFYQGAATRAALEGRSFAAYQDSLGYHDLDTYLRVHPAQRDWTPARRFAWMGGQGRAEVLAAPLTYAGIHLRGMARVAVDPGGVEYLRLYGAYPTHGGLLGRVVDQGLWATLWQVARQRPGLVLIEAGLGLLLVGLYLLGVRALLLTPPRSRVGLLLCLAVAGYLWVASGGPQSLSRFRHPIMPVVCVLAGAGLVAHRRGGPAAADVNQPQTSAGDER